MKSAELRNGKIEIVEKEVPTLQEKKGAIIKISGCGLCGSDIVKYLEKKNNAVLGHEVAGEIVEIKSSTTLKKGDKVVLGHHYPCMICDFCKNKSYSMCETFKKTNIFPCGFSEYIYVTEGHLQNTVFKIPDNLDEIEASFMEPLACCIRAVKRAGYKKIDHPQNALVIGLGSIGVLMGQALQAFGVKAWGFDINEERQKFAKQFDILFDPDIKYDSIFMTSGSYRAIDTALKYIKAGGKIIVFSSIKNEDGYKNNDIYYKELSVIGSYSPAPKDLAQAIHLLGEGKIKVKGFSTVYTLDKLQKAVDDTIENKIFKGYITICQK
jgi:L-iditol 2-dehydrogenase